MTFSVRAHSMFWEDSIPWEYAALARPGCCLHGLVYEGVSCEADCATPLEVLGLSLVIYVGAVWVFLGEVGESFLNSDFENLVYFILYIKMCWGPFLLTANERWGLCEANRAEGLCELTGEVQRWNQNKGQLRNNKWLTEANGNWILIVHLQCKWHIHSVLLLELSFRRSGDTLEECQKRAGRAVGDFRSRSSEESDGKSWGRLA